MAGRCQLSMIGAPLLQDGATKVLNVVYSLFLNMIGVHGLFAQVCVVVVPVVTPDRSLVETF